MQLRSLDVLGAAFDFDQTFPCHIAPINLQYTDKVCLTEFTEFANFADILADRKILFNSLFHEITPIGLNLVLLGLFYVLAVLQWD